MVRGKGQEGKGAGRHSLPSWGRMGTERETGCQWEGKEEGRESVHVHHPVQPQGGGKGIKQGKGKGWQGKARQR